MTNIPPQPYPAAPVPGAAPVAPFPTGAAGPMPPAGESVVNWQQLMHEAEAAGANFNPLPNDHYDCVVVEAEPKTSNNGKLMYKLKFKVMAGPHANRFIWDQLVVSTDNPNALKWFFQKAAALGCDAQYFATNPGPAAVAQNMLNRQVRLQVESGRMYNGQVQTDVKNYVALGAAAPVQQAAPVQAAVPQQPMAPAPVVQQPVAPAPQPVVQPVAPAPEQYAAPAAPVAAPAPVAPAAPVYDPNVAVAPAPAPVAPAPAPQVVQPAAVPETPQMPAPPPAPPF